MGGRARRREEKVQQLVQLPTPKEVYRKDGSKPATNYYIITTAMQPADYRLALSAVTLRTQSSCSLQGEHDRSESG